MSIIQGTSKAAGGFYTIDQSTRFNDDDSAYLTRTPGSASSHTTFTFSMWIKRCQTGNMRLFSTAFGVSNKEDEIYFENLDRLQWQSFNGGSYGFRLLSKAVYRDFSAWMHIVAVLDSTNGTAADRQRLYVNGERITAFDAEVQASASYASSINNTQAHYISRYYASAVALYDGYMAEFYFIDGQALDPSSFGEVNSITGQWVPIEYTGSYGTNGFYITGEDSADLGADYSGNGNDFTSSGLATNDQVTDTPTNNHCVMQPVWLYGSTVSNGNLKVITANNGNPSNAFGTVGMSSGKWYWEYTQDVGATTMLGIVAEEWNANNYLHNLTQAYLYYAVDGNKYNNGSGAAYGASYTVGDIIGVAFDADTGSLTFYKNGVSQGEAYSGIPASTYFPCHDSNSTAGHGGTFNFGQLGFTYTPPTDFIALSTANLDDPTIALPTNYFQTVLDTGANIKTTAEALYTDQFEWIKDRDNINNHQLIDSVRGTSAVLQSNTTAAETTYSAPSGNSVGWVWKANGTGSSNTDGTITSTVSANPAGFSIVSYTGSGTDATVGHGLGITPKFFFGRNRTGRAAWSDWYTYHTGIGQGGYIFLNTSGVQQTSTGVWNNTAPTSSVFSLGAGSGLNYPGDAHIMYCFAEVENFSKFGSYTGNGSANGPMVNCGFLPAFVMVKALSTANGWSIVDTKRDIYNPVKAQLAANGADAEASGVAMDFLSSGFKIRDTSAGFNTNTNSYIYMAFAESPFKTANAR